MTSSTGSAVVDVAADGPPELTDGKPPANVAHPVPRTAYVVVALLVTVGSGALMMAPLVPQAIGGIAVVMMLGLMSLQMPLYAAMSIPSLLAIFALRGDRAVEGALMSVPYASIASWSLSVIPMFILVGVLLSNSSLSTAIYSAARSWLSWMPGGLAVGTTAAGAGLSSVSGSSMATTFTMARIGLPEMFRAGYPTRLSLVAVMASGLPGQLIPPSILLIIYAGIVEVPVGQQLMAGVGPGILVAVMFAITFVVVSMVMARTTPDSPLRGSRTTNKERLTSLAKVWPLPLLALVIFGGIYSGWFTATESAAVAALLAVFILLVVERSPRRWLRGLVNANSQALVQIGSIFLMLIGVNMFSRMMSLTGLSTTFSDMVVEADLSRVQFLLIMTLIYLVLGTFMETLPMMLLTVPVLLPTLATLDISLLWFGVFFVLMGEFAMLSPPVGVLAMVTYSIARDPRVSLGRRVTLKDVFAAVALVAPVVFLIVLVLIAFPGIATMLVTGG